MRKPEEYILQQPDEDQRTMLLMAYDIVLSVSDKISVRLSYGVPFFNYTRGLCYLSTRRNGTVYIGFMRGIAMDDPAGILEADKRKVIRAITFTSPEDPKFELLADYVQKAIDVEHVKVFSFPGKRKA
ncbi:MAG: DUF1801 domain-containing protein [Bacteroidia bacterium]|nr:DUF1801 domain-containing protein [Bacteroidia bacterium]